MDCKNCVRESNYLKLCADCHAQATKDYLKDIKLIRTVLDVDTTTRYGKGRVVSSEGRLLTIDVGEGTTSAVIPHFSPNDEVNFTIFKVLSRFNSP